MFNNAFGWLIAFSFAAAVGSFHLYYQPTLEGFTQVLNQYKSVHTACQLLGCSITFVAASLSQHAYETDMCNLLVLPNSTSCASVLPEEIRAHCITEHFDALGLDPGTEVCVVQGANWTAKRMFIEGYAGPHSHTRTTLPGFPLQLVPGSHQETSDIYSALGILDYKTGRRTRKLVVVHWRRGDQDRRCDKGSDHSLNCADAETFIEMVKAVVKDDSFIYVATNEEASSSAHDLLEAAGMATLVQLLRTVPESKYWQLRKLDSARGNNPDSLYIFLTELMLMIEADSFLAWGSSTVNDMVNYERMMRGRSYCALKEATFCRRFAPPAEPPFPNSTYTISYGDEVVRQYCRMYPEYCEFNASQAIPSISELVYHPPVVSNVTIRDYEVSGSASPRLILVSYHNSGQRSSDALKSALCPSQFSCILTRKFYGLGEEVDFRLNSLVLYIRHPIDMLLSGYSHHRACNEPEWTNVILTKELHTPHIPSDFPLKGGNQTYCQWLSTHSEEDGLNMEMRRMLKDGDGGIGVMLKDMAMLQLHPHAIMGENVLFSCAATANMEQEEMVNFLQRFNPNERRIPGIPQRHSAETSDHSAHSAGSADIELMPIAVRAVFKYIDPAVLAGYPCPSKYQRELLTITSFVNDLHIDGYYVQ